VFEKNYVFQRPRNRAQRERNLSARAPREGERILALVNLTPSFAAKSKMFGFIVKQMKIPTKGERKAGNKKSRASGTA